MKITNIEINHLHQPIGYKLDHLYIQAFIEGNDYPSDLEKCIEITTNQKSIYTSEWQKARDLIFEPQFVLEAQTRYLVRIKLRANQKQWQAETFFETGLLDQFKYGQWIGTTHQELHGICLSKEITLPVIKQARLYISGLGLYEVYLDGNKVGDEYLAPGFTDYNYYVQIASHDVTDALNQPGKHQLMIMLADGWYRGKFGIETHGGAENRYGDKLQAIAELHVITTNGEQKIVATDDKWVCTASPVSHSGIYYGEDLDLLRVTSPTYEVVTLPQPSKYVYDRLSLPVKAHEQLPVKKIITTPSSEIVLDFGQNLAGWVSFKDRLKAGQRVEIQYGELLQNGELYRENLRNARASFTYVSDGKGRLIRPHFTYFGFRYVKLSGFENITATDFKAVALYSDMETVGAIETNNSGINRLFKNVLWGQKSNFIDIPTDCPQRDERLGWTGDAGIFAKTASYNMDTYRFFTKYELDLAVEQSKNEGRVPLYAPAVDGPDGGKAVWGDVTTIIPWVSYLRSGDKTILQSYFGAMMSWVDWIYERPESLGNPYLWLGDEQLGDWLALDTEDIMGLKGKTPDDLIASAYYYYSAKIVAQTALVLKRKHEYRYYGQLAKQIKAAFQAEFFTSSGRLITDTQTGLALLLNLDLVPKNGRQKAVVALVNAVSKNRLTTGFVGTPNLLPALSANGYHDLAMTIFLSKHYPSWLFEVKKGATTIWERWNSLDETGKIAENGMNSLNHYSSGAVFEWVYEFLLGLRQVSQHELVIKPFLSSKLTKLKGTTKIPDGTFSFQWQITGKTMQEVKMNLTIPYGTKARLELPDCQQLRVNDKLITNGSYLKAGDYQLSYRATKTYINHFDIQTPLKQYCHISDLTKGLAGLVPFWDFLSLPGNLQKFSDYSLFQLGQEMKNIGFKPLNKETIQKIDDYFKAYALKEGN